MKFTGSAGNSFEDLPPDIYEVEIEEVWDEHVSEYGTSLPVKLKVTAGEFKGDDTVDFIRLNDSVADGIIGPRSRLYKLISAMGIDVTSSEFAFDSDEWAGNRLRVRIDYPDLPAGGKGDRPKPVDYLPYERAKRKAGKPGLRDRLDPEEDSD